MLCKVNLKIFTGSIAIMNKFSFIKIFMSVGLSSLLTCTCLTPVSAQTQRKYEEHEVIEIGDGMKIEVLKCRGEGENEECNVIYYAEKRQTGRRVWEKTGKLREMERAAKLAAQPHKQQAKKQADPIENTPSFSTQEAEKLNAAEEKRQQDEALKLRTATQPKAVMKPKVTPPSNLLPNTTSTKSIVQKTSPSKDTLKVAKAKITQPVAGVKKTSSSKDTSAKKSVVKKTLPPADTMKMARAKVVPSIKEVANAQRAKDSLQRLAAKKPVTKTTPLTIDSTKSSKTKVALAPANKPKVITAKDSLQTLATAKKPVANKTASLRDTAKTTKVQVALAGKDKPKTRPLKDSIQPVASAKKLAPKTSSPGKDTAQIAQVRLTNPGITKPKTQSLKDSTPRVATTKNIAKKTPATIAKFAVSTSPQTTSESPKATYSVVSKAPVKPASDKPASALSTLSTPVITSTEGVSTTEAEQKTVVVKDSVAKPVNDLTANITPAPNSAAKISASTTTKTTSAKDKSIVNIKALNAATGNRKFVFDSLTAIRIAVFAPLYIDDAFIGTTYNLGKANLPKNILTGLEFYNGVMMAVDSLSLEGVNAEVMIYDTRQSTKTLNQILEAPELNNIGLAIANITNTAELKQFSQFAVKKNIPLISTTYPNTVGVRDNPFFVLLNSSFPVHLDGLYKHMQRFYATDNIIAVRRPGATEDFIKNYITSLNKAGRTTPLNIRWIDLKETFSMADIARNLDSTKNNIVFVASPLESFGLKVVKTLSSNPSYRSTAIGMPTWDGIKELNGRDCGRVEIVYSTPFVYTSQNVSLSSGLIKKYRDKYYSRPSDMAFKGFETTYHFGKLLSKYQSNLVNNLSDKSFTLFNQFDIQPVKLKKESIRPDYLENKKLYFIKKQEGNIKSII